MNDNFMQFVPITKVDPDNQTVEGWATDETIDSQMTKDTIGDVIDYDATKRAVDGWSKWRNIREMHGPSAAGVAEKIMCDDKRRGLYIVAKIVDPTAWLKCKTGVYKGFSIGGKMRSAINEFRKDKGGYVRRITDYMLTEISLVDNPANPAAQFTMVKRADTRDYDPNGVPLPPHMLSLSVHGNNNVAPYDIKKNIAALLGDFENNQMPSINLGERKFAEGNGYTAYSTLGGNTLASFELPVIKDVKKREQAPKSGSNELYQFIKLLGSRL